MDQPSVFFTLFIFSLMSVVDSSLQSSGNHVCTRYQSYTASTRTVYYTRSGNWLTGHHTSTHYRTTYVQKSRPVYYCCPGWTQRRSTDSGCSLAICYGKTNTNGACNSRGSCVSPDKCVCNTGYAKKIYVPPNHGKNECDACLEAGGDPEHSIYWNTNSHPDCELTCSWKNHWCWPGDCPDRRLRTSCACRPGFRKVDGGTSSTKCDLTAQPDLLKCQIRMTDVHGSTRSSTSGATNTGCQYESDTYINLKPKSVSFTLFAAFKALNLTHFPVYIQQQGFGVVEGQSVLSKMSLSGHASTLRTDTLHGGSDCSDVLSDTTPSKDLTCSKTFPSGTNINNGERLCIHFSTTSGGYFKYSDFNTHSKGVQIFSHQTVEKQLCFRYDSSKPIHCSQLHGGSKCSSQPLMLSTRITRNNTIDIEISGWSDPIPNGGNADTASGLAYKKVEIMDMTTKGSKLDIVNPALKKIQLKESSNPLKELNVTMLLPEKSGLYAVLLEIVDKAGNIQTVRRFVLYDKNSIITSDPLKPLQITTASTNNVWQTNHGPVCIDWKGRYYNDHFKDNNPLLPIMSQTEVEAFFDQTSGPLPVNGTINVDGITEAHYSVSIDKGTSTSWIAIPQFTKESMCLTPNLLDGQIYTIQLRMTDVLKNSYTESISVDIDSTVPDISHMWLVKDGHKQVYVHDSLDMSTMVLQFDVTDPHSGVKFVEWYLGTKDHTQDLGHGVLSVQKLNETTCPPTSACYCPSVGQCQYSNYTVTLNSLVANNTNTGQHNQEFYFTVVATNGADLRNIDHLDILVDNSPPEIGSVKEGSTGSPDVDYTSEETVLVNWRGFIDHESGINHYLVALAPRCLNIDEMEKLEVPNASSIPAALTEVKFPIPTAGKFYASVVAYNEALSPSEVACSDGIIKDTSPPAIYNVSLSNAKTSKHLVCHDSSAWLVSENLIMKKLTLSAACQKRCSNSTVSHIADILPRSTLNMNDTELTDNLCRDLPYMDKSAMIYLPVDKIFLTWNCSEMESQIRDISVGFGSDISTQQSPDLLDYKSTKGHHFYKLNHAGLAGKTVFYIFIKAVNKAGLATYVNIGPIMIDNTPPIVKEALKPEVDGTFVYVKWHNTTFEDLEQPDSSYMVLYRIAHNGEHVTPILQTPEAVVKSCQKKDYAGCVRYPLKRMKMMDSELNQPFTFELYVYNSAGHFSVVSTEEIRIPSSFSPGPGTVHDLDPSALKQHQDVDYHISPYTACVQWGGFYHHTGVTFEVAFGTAPNTSDVIAYQATTSNNQMCVNSSALHPRIKYYATVKARCPSGTTYASSDGLVIIDQLKYGSFPKLFDGIGCKKMKSADNVALKPVSTTSVSSTHGLYTTVDRLHIGQTYTLQFERDFQISDTSDVVSFPSKGFKNSVQIIPLVYFPTLNITLSTQHNTSQAPTINMCSQDDDYQISRSTKSFHWVYDGPWKSFTTHFEIKLEEKTRCPNGSICLITVGSKEIKASMNYIDFTNVNLHLGKNYLGKIRPCFDKSCLDWVSSDGVAVVSDNVQLGMSADFEIVPGNKCEALSLTVDYIDCDENPSDRDHITFQWSAADRHGSLLEPWKAVQELLKGKATVCLTSKSKSHDDLQICLRATCPSGLTTTVCSVAPGKRNMVSDTVLIETSIKFIEDIKNKMSSINDNLQSFDIDYAESSIQLAGVLRELEGRNSSWYIMLKQKIPVSDCQTDKECIARTKSKGPIGTFPGVSLINNEYYFICVHSPVQHSSGGSVFPEISQCGDGFIIDNDPPTRGEVHILNQKDGFITEKDLLIVSWTGFTDHETLISESAVSGIANFSYSVGTLPGSEDVAEITSVGFVHITHIKVANLSGGESYYITIQATDYIGHVTAAVSDPVTVDVTPPISGEIYIGSAVESHMTVSGDSMLVHWNGFHDEESGIASFQVALSSKETSEVIPYKEYTGSFAKLETQDRLVDGHQYMVKVEVTNQAGLAYMTVSPTFIFDSSPPVVGVVRDGRHIGQAEADYQVITDNLTCHWTDFHDPHSSLSYFRVGLGTLPHTDDVETMTHVGLRSEISWSELPLGTKLYCMVEVCNSAGLCSRSASDGIILDNSPPVPGVVYVGRDGHHNKYHGHVSMLAVSWFGFEDPQTEINHFDWCIGSAPGECDVVAETNNLLSDSVIKTGLNLPLGTLLYVTVNATNSAGLVSSSTSDSFIVDNSSPHNVRKPVFLSPNTLSEQDVNTQWENSLLKLAWKFEDAESPIERHIVSLSVHHDSAAAVENVHLGAQDTATILFDDDNLMRSGDTYTAVVTACNAAGLCSSVSSSDILIDSTPPEVGGVKYPLSWETNHIGGRIVTRLHLRWYGFTDAESGILAYSIVVSRSYDDYELSGGTLTIKHNSSQEDQFAMFDLTDHVLTGENIVVTLAAENHAGLISKEGKVTLMVVASDIAHTQGNLDIQRHSCSAKYCTGDCTCAVVGKKCPFNDHHINCTDITKSLHHTLISSIQIFPGLTGDETVTKSVSCLTGHWHVENNTTLQHIKRFEWSMGQRDQNIGYPIFDLRKEDIWYSVGKRTQVIHCLPDGRSLKHNMGYVIYLRVWFSYNQYAVFMSHPVLVDHTPPTVRRTKAPLDSDDNCQNDMDFFKVGKSIKICWDNVFQDAQSSLKEYEFWLGTSPEGNDVQDIVSIGNQTSFNISLVLLKTATKYYATIRATNSAGLQTTSVTDGFVIDDVPPVAGVVFTTDHHRNIRAQASNTTLRSSWHGFEDYHSYVESFQVAVLETVQTLNKSDFKYVGLENELRLADLKLEAGKSYRVAVRAVDAAGLFSDIAFSPTVQIDTTPPYAFECTSFLIKETLKSESKVLLIPGMSTAKLETSYTMKTGKLYEVTVAGDMNLLRTYVTIAVGKLSVMMRFEKKQDGVEASHRFISEEDGNINITVTVSGETVSDLLKVHIRKCHTLSIANPKTAVRVRQIRPSVVAVCTNIMDPESDLKSVWMGAGTSKGGYQIRPLSPTAVINHEMILVQEPHGSPVYVTVMAENRAGLRTIFTSSKIIIDHTSPAVAITNVNINYGQVSDNEISLDVDWHATDNESDVDICYCAAGQHAHSFMSTSWQEAQGKGLCIIHNITAPHNSIVYANVRCINSVNLETTSSSEPVLVLHNSPVLPRDSLKVLVDNQISTSHLTSRVQAYSDHVELLWSGIGTKGVAYECRLMDGSFPVTNWTSTGARTHCRLDDLSMVDGHMYEAQVRAKDGRQQYSHTLNASIFAESRPPMTTGKKPVISSANGHLTVDWRQVFDVINMDVVYIVSMGTRQGYADIANQLVTKDTQLKARAEENFTGVYLTITAQIETGKFSLFSEFMTLSEA